MSMPCAHYTILKGQGLLLVIAGVAVQLFAITEQVEAR